MRFMPANFNPESYALKPILAYGKGTKDKSRWVKIIRDRQYSHLYVSDQEAISYLLDSLDQHYPDLLADRPQLWNELFPSGLADGSWIPDGLIDRFATCLASKGYRVVVFAALLNYKPVITFRERKGLAFNGDVDAINPAVKSILTTERGQHVFGSLGMIEIVLSQICRVLSKSRILITCPHRYTNFTSLQNRLRSNAEIELIPPSSTPDWNCNGRVVCCCPTEHVLGVPQYSLWDYVIAIGDRRLVNTNNFLRLEAIQTLRFHTFLTELPEPSSLTSLYLESLSGPVRYQQTMAKEPNQKLWPGVKVAFRKAKTELSSGLINLGLSRNWLNQIADITKNMLGQFGQTIVFAQPNAQAFALQQLLNSPVLHGDMTDDCQAEIDKSLPVRIPITPLSQGQRVCFETDFRSGSEKLAIVSPDAETMGELPKLRCIVRADAHFQGGNDSLFVRFARSTVSTGKPVRIIDFWGPECGLPYSRLASHYQLYSKAGFKLPESARQASPMEPLAAPQQVNNSTLAKGK